MQRTLPPMSVQKPTVAFEAISVDRVRRIDCVEEDIVEKGLESRDGVPVVG